jgi:ElaB/YqjD/DUF883 family membrane-anchored ribosome-binding protein
MTTTRQNTSTRPAKPAAPRPAATDQIIEVDALRADLEMTRRHLADTVQELSRQLNVPRRIKDSAASAGHRAVQMAGQVKQRAGERAKHLPDHAKNLPAKAKQAPELSRKHPKATAAVGGAVALGVGAATWLAGRKR